jgi:hypothetical protein
MQGVVLYSNALVFKTSKKAIKSLRIISLACFNKQALAVSTTSVDVNP